MATARIPQPITDDPVKVDSKHYKVEFENDRVRVVRIKYKAREKSVMHSHPESSAVFLTDAHAKFTYPDGKSEDIKAKAGSSRTSIVVRYIYVDSETRLHYALAEFHKGGIG